jgi:hypothetical protein
MTNNMSTNHGRVERLLARKGWNNYFSSQRDVYVELGIAISIEF